MKKFVLSAALLAAAVWNALAQTGAIKVCLVAKPGFQPGFYDEKRWSFTLRDGNWYEIRSNETVSGTGSESYTLVFSNLKVGDYYVYGRARLESNWFSHQYYDAFHTPWLEEFYNDASYLDSATPISVIEGDTVEVTFELEWATYIVVTTSPESWDVITVNSAYFTAPHTFRWKQSDIYKIGVDEWIQPVGQTYRMRFREWRHGGDRMQDYIVPAPKFMQVADSLIARFDYYYQLDVTSIYGHPQGSGWHKAWTPVQFSVEDSVVEYSDDTFRFLKPFDPAAKDSLLHVFDHWEGTGYLAYSGTDNPAIVSLYTATVEKAHWRDKLPLVAISNDTAMGTVTVQPNDRWHFRDSTAVLRAVPKKGCRFIGWEGAKTDTHLTVSVLMDTSKSFIARFEKIETGFLEVQLIAKPGLIPGSVPYRDK
ncbi:MAG TPA: hypothetical protein VGB38_05235, partial [bacterium]